MSITTFADLIADPASEKVFLVEIQPSQQLVGWAVDAGSVYKTTIGARDISSLTEDDATLTEVATRAAVAAGKWYYDGNILYVQPTSGTPYVYTYVLIFNMYFGSKGVVFNDNYYEPFVHGIPVINQKKKDPFWGVSLINNGRMTLSNHLGFFDEIYSDYAWDNRTIEIKAGGEDLPYGEYQTMFKGAISKTKLKTDTLAITFIDTKTDWDSDLVQNTFNKTTYPNLLSENSGRPIPMPWGTVYNMPVICTTEALGTATSNHSFKVADTSLHSVVELTQIKVNGIAKTTVAAATSSASFVLNTATYNPGDEVTVDLVGYGTGGTVIENPIEIMKEIGGDVLGIDYATNWDTATISVASAEAAVFPIGLAVVDFQSAIDIAADIMKSCLGTFYTNNEGLYAISIWSTDIPAEPDEINFSDLNNFQAQTVSGNIRKTVRVGWRKNWATGHHTYEAGSQSDTERIYNVARSRRVPTLLSSETGATIFQSRLLLLYQSSTIIISFNSKLQLAQKNVGDRFSLSFKRRESDSNWSWLDEKIVEIQSIKKDFTRDQIKITVDDLKGIGAFIGHWTGDSPTFPASLGGGSGESWDSTWSAAKKAYAKSQWGYWCDDNGFADPSDPDSFMISRWW